MFITQEFLSLPGALVMPSVYLVIYFFQLSTIVRHIDFSWRFCTHANLYCTFKNHLSETAAKPSASNFLRSRTSRDRRLADETLESSRQTVVGHILHSSIIFLYLLMYNIALTPSCRYYHTLPGAATVHTGHTGSAVSSCRFLGWIFFIVFECCPISPRWLAHSLFSLVSTRSTGDYKNTFLSTTRWNYNNEKTLNWEKAN